MPSTAANNPPARIRNGKLALGLLALALTTAACNDKPRKHVFAGSETVLMCESKAAIESVAITVSTLPYFDAVQRLNAYIERRMCFEGGPFREANLSVAEEKMSGAASMRIVKWSRTASAPLRPGKGKYLYSILVNKTGATEYGWEDFPTTVMAQRTVGGLKEFFSN